MSVLESQRLVFLRNWIAFFCIGTINNLAYVVVNTAAQDLVDVFHKSHLIALIPWANVALGFFVRSLNAFFLEGVSYNKRVIANGCVILGGLVVVAFSVYLNFWILLIGVLMTGSGSSFGENVFLGYMRKFNPQLVGGWSSGTGLAGVLGAVAYLVFVSIGLDNTESFLALTYTVALYFFCFFFLLIEGKDSPESLVEEESLLEDDSKFVNFETAEENAMPRSRSNSVVDSTGSGDEEKSPLLDVTDTILTEPPASLDVGFDSPISEGSHVIEQFGGDDARPQDTLYTLDDGDGDTQPLLGVEAPKENVEQGGLVGFLAKLGRCIRVMWWKSLNLGLVYFFEYVVSTGCADKAEKRGSKDSTEYALKHSFVILAFCYQVGVFISRSSLRFFRIKHIEILTFLQGLNLVLWLFIDMFKFVNVYIQFVLMVYVGLLGGASYVNVFYLLLHDPRIRETDRELCVNLAALTITFGITTASCFMLLMANTFLKDK